MNENLTQVINTRLTDEQLAILENRARELGTNSISVALRAIITEWAREHQSDGQPQPSTQESAA